MVGYVSLGDISGLTHAIRMAAFFTPSPCHLLDAYGMVFPGGPVRCLSVADGGVQRTLYYHGRDDLNRLDQIAPTRARPEKSVNPLSRCGSER